jgi:hypothetical protein
LLYFELMKPIIQQLLKELEIAEPDYRLNYLMDIGDYLGHPYPQEDGYAEVVQQLINLLTKEKNVNVRTSFFRNIATAYMFRVDLSEIDFGPLIQGLDKKDPVFIGNVLYLLSMTYKAKYKKIISKYLSHPDEKVRNEANDALNYLP